MAFLTNDLLNLARQHFGQLTDADKKLFDAVARHEEANFKSDTDELNQPDTWKQWGKQRTLKADRLVWLVTAPEVAAFLSCRGLRLTGAHIEGPLDLEYATVSVPLMFNACVFSERLVLQKSRLRGLQLKGTRILQGIAADDMRVEDSVDLCDGLVSSGKVSLVGASITGDFNCERGHFTNPEDAALNAEQAGEGDTDQSNKKDKTAIDANSATIGGSVYLGNGFRAEGEVNLVGASIRGQLACSGGQFINLDKKAINANGATITASVHLRNGFRAEGEVNLCRAAIGGQLACSGGQFINPGKTAINASGATIAASVHLRNGFRAEGEVNLVGASIGGQLACNGGQFINPGKTAIDAESARTAGSVFLGGDFTPEDKGPIWFQAEGTLNFYNATVGSELLLISTELSHPEKLILDLSFAKVNTFSLEGESNTSDTIWAKQLIPI